MKAIFTLSLLILANIIIAQPADTIKNWKTGVESSLAFSQVSLSNWAAGGESSISGNAFLNLSANYKKDKSQWENNLELAYGLMKQGKDDVRKTNDKIYFSTTYGYQAVKKFYYSASLNFKSQFAKGYNYPNDSVEISNFLAPAYILAALGMEYKQGECFSLTLSPLSGRLIIVNDDTLSKKGAFGVEKGEKLKLEFGSSFKMNFKKEIIKNVDLSSKLELFSNYLDDPQNIDVFWEMLINMKINNYLSANISTTLIYDDDIMITDKNGNTGPRTQFKEVFGIGFSYKFPSE